MRMLEAIVAYIALAFLFGGLSISPIVAVWKTGDVAVSCNNLKAAAIAASQPEPKCHGEK